MRGSWATARGRHQYIAGPIGPTRPMPYGLNISSCMSIFLHLLGFEGLAGKYRLPSPGTVRRVSTSRTSDNPPRCRCTYICNSPDRPSNSAGCRSCRRSTPPAAEAATRGGILALGSVGGEHPEAGHGEHRFNLLGLLLGSRRWGGWSEAHPKSAAENAAIREKTTATEVEGRWRIGSLGMAGGRGRKKRGGHRGPPLVKSQIKGRS